jgi:hypothetical protein
LVSAAFSRSAAACRYVRHNNIGGELPVQYSALTNLKVLCVAPMRRLFATRILAKGKPWGLSVCSDSGYNSLTGLIPPAVGSLLSIRTIILEHNALTGTVPASFFASMSLKTLYAPRTLSALSALCASLSTPLQPASKQQPDGRRRSPELELLRDKKARRADLRH